MTKRKYTIVIEIEADYIPSDAMDELTGDMAVQAESLVDGTMERLDGWTYPHTIVGQRWYSNDLPSKG